MLDLRIPKCDIQIQHSKIFKPYLVLYSLRPLQNSPKSPKLPPRHLGDFPWAPSFSKPHKPWLPNTSTASHYWSWIKWLIGNRSNSTWIVKEPVTLETTAAGFYFHLGQSIVASFLNISHGYLGQNRYGSGYLLIPWIRRGSGTLYRKPHRHSGLISHGHGSGSSQHLSLRTGAMPSEFSL